MKKKLDERNKLINKWIEHVRERQKITKKRKVNESKSLKCEND